MDDTVGNVARAIATAFDCSATQDARKAAVSFIGSMKCGDVRILANTSLNLVRRDWSSEIRLHGFKMLQHLVRFRWDELNDAEHRDFATMAVNFISEMAKPEEEWVLKSQSAALVAEIVRRGGVNAWEELLPSLISFSNKGPIDAELVAMILRWLPEDITVHNEDLEGDRRRELLRGLTDSLGEILPLLYMLLERHFSSAITEYGNQHLVATKQHIAAVTAALNAANAFAEWAPVHDLAKHKLIQGCGFLLSSQEFRLPASEFFKLIAQRKRPIDSTPEFDSSMALIFQILMNESRVFLSKSIINYTSINESDYEYIECICESMAALGSSHMHCISGNETLVSDYLQLMLAYFKHYKLALHFHSLLFWLTAIRESTSKQKTATADVAGGNYVEKKAVLAFTSDDMCDVILNVSLQRMVKKDSTSGSTQPTDAIELWSDEFDGKVDFAQYRSRLLELLKLVASQKPMVAITRISQRINTVICSSVIMPTSAQEIALLESLQLGLETIVSATFNGSCDVSHNSELNFELHRTLEGLLQRLLSLTWTEPALAELLGHLLDAFGPYLKYFPESVAAVVNKLFDLLTSLPYMTKDPLSLSTRHARLQICSSFIRIARAADKSLMTHMKSIADTMAHLQAEGRLLRAEHNILGEAFLIMASSTGIQQQQEVLAWLLEPVNKQWVQLEWQTTYLSDPSGFTHLCSDTKLMWNLFHAVTFFEKALKRSGNKKANWSHTSASDTSIHPHPISSHLSWMLPPLLKLLRCIHSLWFEPISQSLGSELRAAKSMNHVEQSSLLGGGSSKPLKGQISLVDGNQVDMNKEGGTNENDIRNWLKGVRESGYGVIGLSTSLGDYFFQCIDPHLVLLALVENMQWMEFRHLRQLIHAVIIPLVKHCPPNLWGSWLENVLDPLFTHCQQALSLSWASLLSEGRAKVPDNFGSLTGLELKLEVMEEKLLRDLTRELCWLLSVLASPALNNGLPSYEQLANANRMEATLPTEVNAFASSSMISFLMGIKGVALPALRISIEIFNWTDGDSVAKIVPFCGSLINLAASTKNMELAEFVGKDLFHAIINGLGLESNAIISSDLVGLCREIYIHLLNRDSSPRQVLLSFASISMDELRAFEDAMSKTSSPKEQKQFMRNLLQMASGNQLKALAAQKITNVITNVTARARNTQALPGSGVEDDGAIGLAAIAPAMS